MFPAILCHSPFANPNEQPLFGPNILPPKLLGKGLDFPQKPNNLCTKKKTTLNKAGTVGEKVDPVLHTGLTSGSVMWVICVVGVMLSWGLRLTPPPPIEAPFGFRPPAQTEAGGGIFIRILSATSFCMCPLGRLRRLSAIWRPRGLMWDEFYVLIMPLSASFTFQTKNGGHRNWQENDMQKKNDWKVRVVSFDLVLCHCWTRFHPSCAQQVVT